MAYYFEENQWGERYLPDVNRDTFSSTKCCDVYKQDLDIDLSAKDTLHVFVGSDSGLMLKYLQENLCAPGSCAIVIEQDKISPYIDLAHTHEGLSDVQEKNPPRVKLFNASDWQSSDSLTAYHPWFFKQSVELHRAHCCFADYDNLYTQLFRETRRFLSEQKIKLQHTLGLQRFIDVQFQNAADNVCPLPANELFGVGNVAIVLAGGPSLDDHMAWILENRDSLFIIAVSRLCDKLNQLNLIPDLVVSIDPLPNMYEVSKQGIAWKEVPLISSNHLTPQLLQQWQGPHYFIGERLPWDQFTSKSRATVKSTGPTVSHTGVIVASHLGFSTILLAGADFCYTATGGTHVDGTPESALLSLPSGYDAQLTTYSGRTAGTSLPLSRGIDTMALIGKNINSETDRLFNLSAEAARIDSIPLINKEDVSLPQSKPSFDSSVPCKPTAASLNGLGRELQDAKRAFRNILDLCKKALVCVDYIYELNGRSATPAHHKRLQNIESRLTKFEQYTKVIKHYHSTEFLKLQTPAGFQAMDRSEMETWARSYYGLLRQGALSLLSLIDTAQNKVQLRKIEQSTGITVEELLTAWDKDNTPGRVLQHDIPENAVLATPERQMLDEASQHYLASLSESPSSAEHHLSDTKTLINNCINSVFFLFHTENTVELKSLSTAISRNIWPNDDLISLTNALIHELNSEKESAMVLYQSIVDSCRQEVSCERTEKETVERLIETALIRLTQCHLSKSNGQQALQPLAELSMDNPLYMCSYARLLDMLGQTEKAIDQVQQYLQLRPNDWRAAQQLSEHYSSIGATESAELALTLAKNTRYAGQKIHQIAA